VLRPLATPLALGFLALAIASFTVSGLQLQWIAPGPNWSTIGLLVLALAVPLQSVSAVLGFLTRDPVAGTGMGVLAGTWLALGASTYTSPTPTPSPAVGLLLVASSFALLVPTVAGAGGKLLASMVMAGAAVRFGVTGAYEISGTADWRIAAGIAGLCLSLLALYAAFAFEIEGVAKRTILPTGRHGRGREALAGSFAEEIAQVQHEAGVRQQL
jgi:hypothetical protein